MKIFKKPFMIFLFIGLISIFAGCTVGLNSYSAKAVNIKDDGVSYASGSLTLVGSVVYLYAYNTSTGTYSTTNYSYTTVKSDGTFTFDLAATGKYKLTGSQNGWTFVPQYIELSDAYSELPDLLAFPTYSDSEVTIVTQWTNAVIDVDAVLTYGDDSIGTTVTSDWTSINYNPTGDGNRIKISKDARGAYGDIYLNRTVSSSSYGTTTSTAEARVETITLYDADWLTAGDIIYFYVDTYYDNEEGVTNGTVPYQSLTGYEAGNYASPYAQVHVMYGQTYRGTWILPYNTNEDTLQVVRLDFNGSAITIASANNADEAYTGIKKVIWE